MLLLLLTPILVPLPAGVLGGPEEAVVDGTIPDPLVDVVNG